MDPRQAPRVSRGLAIAVVVAGTVVRLAVAPSYGYLGVDGDLVEHKQAAHRILTRGLHSVYDLNPAHDPALTGREWDGGFFMNNLPLILYLRAGCGWLYRLAEPERFELWDSRLNFFELERSDLRERLAASRSFTVLLKLPGIAADTAIAVGLLAFVAARAGPGAGLAACAAYSLNPAAVFDTAFWGQHDAVAAGLVAASLGLLLRDRVEAGWAAYALAALTKPQAGAFALLVLGLGLARFPPRRAALAALAATATVAVVFLPFLLHGRGALAVTALLGSTVGGEAYVSCNAANLWWLVSGGNGYGLGDAVALLGPLSARSLGLAAFLVASVTLAWWASRERDDARVFLLAATTALAFFMLCTELHENHGMLALPLLALAAPAARRVWIVFWILSTSFLLNMVVFDPAALASLPGGAGVPVRALSLGLAATNAIVFGFLLVLGARRGRPA